jgi:pimeloyl-ACP methyl ester carboxylesterase
MSDRFVNANELRFHLLDWGGSGKDLILLHPTGFVADIWESLAGRLAQRFHVVAVDARGHGDSDKPDGDYGMRQLVQDLGAVIEALALERPIGIGHSAGATTILALEAERPGTFARAVLMEPVLSFDEPAGPHTIADDPLAASTLKRRAVWPSRQAVYDSYRPRAPFQFWDEAPLRSYVKHGFAERPDGSVELKCSPEAEAQMYLNGSHQFEAADLLPAVRCPTLIVRGEESTVLTQAAADRAAALLPDCRAVTMPGGHFAPFEHPLRIQWEVERFLGSAEEATCARASSTEAARQN